MNTQSKHGTLSGMPSRLLPLLAFALLWSAPLPAQVPVDDDGNPIEALGETVLDDAGSDVLAQDFEADEQPPLTPQELEELVGPVALYPDKLLAIVLPASTYPLEIVQAARFLDRVESDSNLKPDESWDDSVTALLNYPEVVRMMDDDIDWTWRLGEAVVRQQSDVIAAVESFRDRAYAAGNLKTDERQRVSNNAGTIEIQPLEEDIIYVPYYEPERVVHYQPRQVYYYYPRPYPVYYYPYPAHHSFLSGYFWGVTTAFNIGWTTNHLHVFHHSYWGHPYYGRQYFGHYYRRPSIVVYNTYYVNNYRHRPRNHHRDGDYWRPRDGGPRPGRYNARLDRFRDHPRERTVEGYRVPDRNGRGVSGADSRSGFRGDAADRVRNANGASTREGFAASRNDANERNRVRSGAARVLRPDDGNVSRDAPIRFRSRDGATAPVRTERSPGAAGAPRTTGRVETANPDTRRDTSDGIRFRSRGNTDAGTSVRQRSQPPVATRQAPSVRAADRPSETTRSTVRRQQAPAPAASARTTAPAPATRGFKASPGNSAPAARPNVSRPQATPRPAASRPNASVPTKAPRAAPAPSRQDRAAPTRRGGSGASSSGRTTRDR